MRTLPYDDPGNVLIAKKRRCYGCDQRKVLLAFHRDESRALGRGYLCKACKTRRAKVRYRNTERVEQPRVTKKRCSNCRRTKRAALFHRRARGRDGLQSTCSSCQLKARLRWDNENRARKRERDLEYHRLQKTGQPTTSRRVQALPPRIR